MAKTKPIGVRFDEDLLSVLKEDEKIETPQGALNFLSCFWRDNRNGKIDLKETFEKSKIFKREEPEVDQTELLKQIEALKKETIPKERDTRLGRPVWQREQWQKIEKLEKQLK